MLSMLHNCHLTSLMIPAEAMIVPRRSLLLAIWICCCGLLCAAQGPIKGFHWDWRKSQELTSEDSFSQSNTLSLGERTALIKAAASQLRPLMSRLNVDSEPQLQQLAAQTRINPLDLSGKGVEEFVLQGSDDRSCSPPGNCPFWILRRNRNEYSVILHRMATQTLTIQPTITNGFHDIVLGMHGSPTQQGLTLYRFDGSRYRPRGCYEANWQILGKGEEIRRLKEPRITPCEHRYAL
ncbi:MAG: hypothetical protein JWO91_3921 [Acidobacteriaceae bacterium]|jgi:hypothetical protein|nr:hypothetical protein [Acidobacteriaceae bacterium]